MIRNLKVLGLALVAMLALGAVAASAASALTGDVTSDGPVTLTGTETGGLTNNKLVAFGSSVTCEGSTYTGHKYNVTPHEFLEEHFTTVTITPHYNQKKCLASGVLPATVDMNGCDYVLHIGETTNVDEYAVTADVVCPEGKDITVTIFRNATQHAENKPFCILHVKPQAGLQGAEVRDTTNGTLDLTGAAKNVHIVGTDPENAVLCPVTGTEQTVTNGELKLDVTVTGHNGSGTATPLSISEV